MNPSASGAKAMVVSSHALASEAGAEMLRRGGNAFDAAVAVSSCLAVVYPHMTGLGGDSFWLMYSQGDRAVRAYNASGRSGNRAVHMVMEEGVLSVFPERKVDGRKLAVPLSRPAWRENARGKGSQGQRSAAAKFRLSSCLPLSASVLKPGDFPRSGAWPNAS